MVYLGLVYFATIAILALTRVRLGIRFKRPIALITYVTVFNAVAVGLCIFASCRTTGWISWLWIVFAIHSAIAPALLIIGGLVAHSYGTMSLFATIDKDEEPQSSASEPPFPLRQLLSAVFCVILWWYTIMSPLDSTTPSLTN